MTAHLRIAADRPYGPARAVPVAAGIIVGIFAWEHQISRGMAVTGLSDPVPWGAYTIAYLIFVALAAGALVLGCASILERSSPLSRVVPTALATAVAGLVAALVAYAVSLGRPGRLYDLVLHPNWSAPLIWSLCTVLATLVAALVLVALTRREMNPARSTAVRVLSVVAIVGAVAAAASTAGVLTVQDGRAGWTGLVLPSFLVSAVLAGMAAVMLIGRWRRVLGPAGGDAGDERLRRLIVAALVADLALTAIAYALAARSGPEVWAAMQVVLPGGGWSWLFWTQWLAGGLLPLAALAGPEWRRRPVVANTGLALCLVGVVASCVALVPASLSVPRISLPPGQSVGAAFRTSSSFQVLGFYHPTWTEWGVLVGLLSLFLAVLVLVTERAPEPVGTP